MSENKQKTYADVCREAAEVYECRRTIHMSDAAHLRRLADLIDALHPARTSRSEVFIAAYEDIIAPLPEDR